MISVRYHLSYWVLAITAASLYRALPEAVRSCEGLLLSSLLPLFIIDLNLALLSRSEGLIPRPAPWSTGETQRLRHHLAFLATTAAFLISLGALPRFLFSAWASDTEILIAHTLLAFPILGGLEAFRQVREDIEPNFLQGPRIPGITNLDEQETFRVVLAIAFWAVVTVSFAWLFKILNPHLYRSLMRPMYDRGGLLQGHLFLYMICPFSDMAELLFYLFHRRHFRHWLPNVEAETRDDRTNGLFSSVWVFVVWRYFNLWMV